MEPLQLLEQVSEQDRRRLRKLVLSWSLLADLAFSDVLLLGRTKHEGPAPVVLAQVRPATSQTNFAEDLVGKACPAELKEGVISAFEERRVVKQPVSTEYLQISVTYVPIPSCVGGDPPAVLAIASPLNLGRRRGALEEAYEKAAALLVLMVYSGDFPFEDDEVLVSDVPRVGDGLLFLDNEMRITFASPNATSALHHLGISANFVGERLEAVLPDLKSVAEAVRSLLPAHREVASPEGIAVTFTALPLIKDHELAAALVLVHDVTELRRREHALVSKEAALKEVHHRVKNNLQTISSLLRLQKRRIAEPEAREALEEADRRIRAISVVHDLLSAEPEEAVAFDEIVLRLVALIEESYMLEKNVEIAYEGSAGKVPADSATPLAIVVAELIHNALEHGFGERFRGQGRTPSIVIRAKTEQNQLELQVIDNGAGLPEGFDLRSSSGLGLSLVRDLVRSQLRGELSLESGPQGTVATVRALLNHLGNGSPRR